MSSKLAFSVVSRTDGFLKNEEESRSLLYIPKSLPRDFSPDLVCSQYGSEEDWLELCHGTLPTS